MLQMNINGLPCNVLVDTGCTTSIAHVSVCSNCSTKSTSVTTISGEQLQCIGMGIVQVCLLSGASAAVDVLVVKEPPLGFKFILGMNGITAFHGVTVRSQNEVSFGVEQNACVVGRKPEPEMYYKHHIIIFIVSLKLKPLDNVNIVDDSYTKKHFYKNFKMINKEILQI